MRILIVFTMFVSAPVFAKGGLRIVKNQPLIDAMMRTYANVVVTCRNGATVSIRGNTAVMGGQSFNWRAFASLNSNSNGAHILNLAPRGPTNFTYDQLNSVCFYPEYPALVAQFYPPAKPKYNGECNPWVGCP